MVGKIFTLENEMTYNDTITPLSRLQLPRVPLLLKWSGWINDYWCSSAMERLLAERKLSDVLSAWKTTAFDPMFIQQVFDIIGVELSWKYPRFIPNDECFIVMKLWWHGIADGMERERCLWALEQLFGKRPHLSDMPVIMTASFEQFLEFFLHGEFK